MENSFDVSMHSYNALITFISVSPSVEVNCELVILNDFTFFFKKIND